MAFVITELCVGVKDGACTEACPVDAIHGREQDEMLFIDPERCIDCDVCAIACPVNAIFRDKELPERYKKYLTINRDYFVMREEEVGS